MMNYHPIDPETVRITRNILIETPPHLYPAIVPVSVREFFSEKYLGGISAALQECLQTGYQPLFMPELASVRSKTDRDPRIWQTGYGTLSMRATGQTRHGAKVVVYDHQAHFYSDPTHISDAVKNNHLKNGAGPLPQSEFDEIVSLAENGRVFVIPEEKSRKSPSGRIHVDDALEHPHVIPFFGGKAIAQAYLARFRQIFGDRIGVLHVVDDFDPVTPRCRLLHLGYGDTFLGDLHADISLHSEDTHVLGIVPENNLEAKLD